jgi:flagellar biosynthesis protein FliR
MELLNFSPDQFRIFLLVLIRVSVVLYLFPIFSSAMIPTFVKAGLALAMALVLFPVVPVSLAGFPNTIPAVLMMIVSELFIGLVLGLSIRLFMAAVELAGQLIGFQMGFAIINVLDPQTGTQVSIMGQIGNLVVVVVFLALNGHHSMIMGLVESFKVVDIGMIALKQGFLTQVISLAADMFVLAIKIGAPAIVALLFTSAGFGITAKFVPQMNILIAAFPVKIVVGLVFFGMCLQIIALMTQAYLNRLPGLLSSLLKWMGGG